MQKLHLSTDLPVLGRIGGKGREISHYDLRLSTCLEHSHFLSCPLNHYKTCVCARLSGKRVRNLPLCQEGRETSTSARLGENHKEPWQVGFSDMEGGLNVAGCSSFQELPHVSAMLKNHKHVCESCVLSEKHALGI